MKKKKIEINYILYQLDFLNKLKLYNFYYFTKNNQ